MGPLIPDYKQSSDSDEESNVRHDRFRSERAQEQNRKPYSKYRQREDPYRSAYSDRRGSESHRSKSPPRYSRHSNYSSSSYRNESRRSDHDRKRDDKGHRSKSNRPINKYTKIHSNAEESEKVVENVSNKKTLSSLLKNFDKSLESKHKAPEVISESCKEDSETVIISPESITEETLIGPALPPNLKTTSESSVEKLSGVDLLTSNDANLPHALSDQTPTANSEVIHINVDKPSLDIPVQNNDNLKNCPSSSNAKDLKNDFITSSSDSICSALPLETNIDVYGPILPPEVKTDSYGPVLPPNFKKENIQGPTLPAGLTTDQLESLTQEGSEDEDMVGPLPEGKMNMTQFQLDVRASQIKKKLEEEKSGTTDIKKREEWMLELPPEKASNLGLGPRSFRKREAPDMSDRSSWTDTPADKLRKVEQALSGALEPVDSEELKRTAFLKERDQVMDKMSQLSRDEDRPKSLLELHQKKIKKKKKEEDKEGKKKERRPFDRNIDLQVNRFDDAQKKAIFKKAQLLDTRFSSGESKYL